MKLFFLNKIIIEIMTCLNVNRSYVSSSCTLPKLVSYRMLISVPAELLLFINHDINV